MPYKFGFVKILRDRCGYKIFFAQISMVTRYERYRFTTISVAHRLTVWNLSDFQPELEIIHWIVTRYFSPDLHCLCSSHHDWLMIFGSTSILGTIRERHDISLQDSEWPQKFKTLFRNRDSIFVRHHWRDDIISSDNMIWTRTSAGQRQSVTL